jgi:hypothetical protein
MHLKEDEATILILAVLEGAGDPDRTNSEWPLSEHYLAARIKGLDFAPWRPEEVAERLRPVLKALVELELFTAESAFPGFRYDVTDRGLNAGRMLIARGCSHIRPAV